MKEKLGKDYFFPLPPTVIIKSPSLIIMSPAGVQISTSGATAYVSQPHYMNITPGGPESIFTPEAGDTNASTGRLWSLMCHIHSKFKYIAEQPLNILILLKPPGHTGAEKDLQPLQGFLNNKAVVIKLLIFSVFSNFVSVFLSIH